MTLCGLTLNRAWMWKQRKATPQVARCPTDSFMSRPVLVQLGRRALAVALCALLIPVSQADLLAQQSAPPAPPQDVNASAPAQPLTPDQLDQLVAPIALYPDALMPSRPTTSRSC
jgi:hypothetical protein